MHEIRRIDIEREAFAYAVECTCGVPTGAPLPDDFTNWPDSKLGAYAIAGWERHVQSVEGVHPGGGQP
jgi:hypothetical protein